MSWASWPTCMGFLNSLPLILGRRTQDRAGLRSALPPIASLGKRHKDFGTLGQLMREVDDAVFSAEDATSEIERLSRGSKPLIGNQINL